MRISIVAWLSLDGVLHPQPIDIAAHPAEAAEFLSAFIRMGATRRWSDRDGAAIRPVEPATPPVTDPVPAPVEPATPPVTDPVTDDEVEVVFDLYDDTVAEPATTPAAGPEKERTAAPASDAASKPPGKPRRQVQDVATWLNAHEHLLASWTPWSAIQEAAAADGLKLTGKHRWDRERGVWAGRLEKRVVGPNETHWRLNPVTVAAQPATSAPGLPAVLDPAPAQVPPVTAIGSPQSPSNWWLPKAQIKLGRLRGSTPARHSSAELAAALGIGLYLVPTLADACPSILQRDGADWIVAAKGVAP